MKDSGFLRNLHIAGDMRKNRYSQNGEELILLKIFESIGTTNKYLVDFSAGDGEWLSNSKFLIEQQNFKGLLMDGDNRGNQKVKNEIITAENICSLFKEYKVPQKFDLLSIDIDGNDYYVLEAIIKGGYRPRVILTEFNGCIPNGIDKVMKYNASHIYGNNDYYDYSYTAGFRLAKELDYVVVCENHKTNLFMIDKNENLDWRKIEMPAFTHQQYHEHKPDGDGVFYREPIPNAKEKVLYLEPIKSENDSLTLDFLEKISKIFHADVFVETGTLAGGTAAEASKTFREVHTIELSQELFLKATERFQNNSNVHVYHGDSAVVLKNIILPQIHGKAVFWLDGHYSGGETARGNENTPILREIAVIRQQNIRDSVILIDDIRCFYRDPNPASIHYGYPTVRELSSAILAIDPAYCIEVIGDALIAYPLHDEVHVSPVIQGCTISRLCEESPDLGDRILDAELNISQASGMEEEAIRQLCVRFGLSRSADLSKYYALWYGLILYNKKHFAEAVQLFTTLLSRGFSHWRVRWYLARAEYESGNVAAAQMHLQTTLIDQPGLKNAQEMMTMLHDASASDEEAKTVKQLIVHNERSLNSDNMLKINVVYGHLSQNNIKATNRGNMSIIWSPLPIEGCDHYVYHNSFSYRGRLPGLNILLMLEPHVVLPGEFDERIWKEFDHVFGPFDALIGQDNKFHKILFPRTESKENPVTELQSQREFLYPLSRRKNAICMISGNKRSHVPSELYSKRIEVAEWFSRNSNLPFDVYGAPPFPLTNYRGLCPKPRKLSVMKQYRYNLCFENTNHPVLSAGYITEKILDCLETRTIPIYLGASNIEKYIPETCFIDFRKFDNLGELDNYLRSMSDRKYELYVSAIDSWVTAGNLRKYSSFPFYDLLAELCASSSSKSLENLFAGDKTWTVEKATPPTARDWKFRSVPVMWTWKHLMKAAPPVLENGKISSGPRLDANTPGTDDVPTRDHRSPLIGKKPSIKVLAAGVKFFSGDARKGYDYGWWNMFNALHHFENVEAQFFDYVTEAQQRGVAGMSDQLEEIIRKEQPDMLWYSPLDLHADILHESLKYITDNTDTQTIIWMNDDHRRFDDYARHWAPCVDHIITTSHEAVSKYHEAGFSEKIIKSQWAFNPFTYQPLPPPRTRDVSFVGSAKGNRLEFIWKLRQSGLHVDVFGSGWPEDMFIPFFDMVKIFSKSRINLNLSNSSQIKRRNFEVPGCRGLLFTTPADNLEEYYEPDKEVVIASSLEELIDKSRYYLSHERQREEIAQRGYDRTLAEHTWTHRLLDIFQHIGFSAVAKPLPHVTPCPFLRSAPPRIARDISSAGADTLSMGQENKEDIDISIAVGGYNQLEYTRQCVESILHYTEGPYELLLMDNGSTDGTFEYFERVKSFHHNTRVIRNFQNRIVEANSIYTLSLARGKYIVAVANDTMVHDGWLKNLVTQIETAPDIGMVGPCSNNVSGPQAMKAEYDTLETYHTFAADWSKEHRGENFPVDRMVGMLKITKKSIFDRIGGADPNLPTNGRDGGYGFSDDDFSLRFRLAGYKLLVANDVFIHHFGSVTASKYRRDLFGPAQNINKEKYLQKLRENDRVTVGPHGKLTLKPYGPDEHIPVAENMVIRPPRICIVESDCTSETTDSFNRYATLADSYHEEVVSLSSNSKRSWLIEAIAKGKYDFIAFIDQRLAPSCEKVQALIGTALCYPDVAIMVPTGNYAPSTHMRRSEDGKGVEIIQYADLSICVINTKIIRPLIRPLTQIENDEEWFWFLQRRIRGEGYFIAKCNDIIVDLDEPRVHHPCDTQILPEKLIKEKKYEEAIAVYNDDLDKDPTFVESLYQLACITKKQNQTTEAIKCAEDVLKIDPHHIQSLILMSEVFMEQGNVKRAESVVGQANFKQPGNPEVQEVVAQYERLKTKSGEGSKETKTSVVEDITLSKIQFKKKAISDMVSIIITVTGHAKQLKKCIENIRKYTPETHEIIFVENGCDAGILKWMGEAVKTKSNYKLIKAGKGAGQSECYNLGMEASSGEYIVLLHKNVMVGDGWLNGMLRCINRADDVGIVGPMTNAKAAGRQCVVALEHVKVDQLEEYAGAFLERNRHRRVLSRELPGFCMLFRRSLVGQIGSFDEELEQGSGCDDYCLRATLEGYMNIIAGDVFVLCGDFPPQGNKRSFAYKWRDIDAKSHDGERLGVLNAITDSEKLYQGEEIDKAMVKLLDGLKYRPDDESIYHRLAEMLIDSERFKDGFDAINSIPEDKRNSARSLELAGYCKAGLELYDEAAQCAERVLSVNPSSAPALNLMGVLAHGGGDKSASEEFFNKAIASDPGCGAAYTNLGILMWEGGHKEDALETLEKGFILSPTVANSITAYHSAISETAEFERAEWVFREAKTLHPQNRRIAFLLIDILIRQEKYDSAMQDIREAMIAFGINDGILSAAQAVLDRFDAQKAKDTGAKPGLSLCMIVKNEENCLSRCLMSAIPVVDEIVIVDTGSTDRTKEVAKAFGAKIYDFEWTDDFSEARNFSLAKTTGDWILLLDADEVISPLDYDRLTRIVKSNAVPPKAYLITTRNYVYPPYVVGWTCNNGEYVDEEEGTGWYPSRKVRLFPSNTRIRFENPVHEFVESSLKTIGIEIIKSDIPVHHYGQLNRENYIAKGNRYYPLGKKKLEGKGEDLRSLIELAVQAGGEFGKYEEAVGLWNRVLKIAPRNTKALVNLGAVLLKLGKYKAARISSEMAMTLAPDLKEAVIIYTTCEVLIGNVRQAIPIIESLLNEVPGYPLAISILAAAYGIEGETGKGREQIRNLQKMGFRIADYLHELSESFISAGKTDRAVSLLEFAVECGKGTREIRSLLSELKG